MWSDLSIFILKGFFSCKLEDVINLLKSNKLFVLYFENVLQVEKTVWDWELMNDIKPIWQRPAKEVEEDEYTAFYKTFSKVSTRSVELCQTAVELVLSGLSDFDKYFCMSSGQ